MKTNYQTTGNKLSFAKGLAKAILPLLFVLISAQSKAQCSTATNSPPPIINGCQYNDQIDTYTLNGIASPVSPGCSPNAYVYSALPNWNLLMGNTYSFAATTGGNVYYEGFAIWIDLNQDNVYSGTELMYTSAPALAHTGTFVIPFSATPGTTKMRIRDNYYTSITNGATQACDAYSYGETEDYLITLIAPTPCSGAPASNTAIVTPTSAICPGGTANLNLNTTYTVGGITYNWQASTTSSVGPWTSVASMTAFGVTTPTLGAAVWYQAVITCTNTNQSTSSAPVFVNVAGTTTNTIPYFEGFEGITFNNQLPNCSWAASNPSTTCRTYIQANTQNRIPRTGSKFGSFYYNPAGVDYFYTNAIRMEAGVTYSASLWYTTEYYGYTNWTDLSIMVGPSQSTTGLVTIASTNGPALSPAYKSLSNTYTVATSGMYYVAIRGTHASGSAQHLSWDDLSIIVPCSLNTVSVSVNPSNSTICQGASVTISASGANTYSWNTGASTSAIIVSPNSNTTYQVTGTNSLTGCSTQVNQNIVVNPSPVVSIFANSNSVCVGQSTSLYAYGASSYNWSTGGSLNPNPITPGATTTYSVIGTNQFACSNTATIQVSVLSLPTVVAAGTSTSICVGETATLSATGANSYQWTSSNLFIQSQSAVVSPVVNTSYVVSGTDVNGCTNTATLNLSVNGCVGINTISQAASFNVYPNPNSGEFTVEFADNTTKTIQIVDVTGRLIQTSTTSGDKANFNISALANGIYYVKLVSSKTTEVVKIVKQ